MDPDAKVVLVTGGNGMIGHALQKVVAEEGKRTDEKWVFLAQKDADLRKEEDVIAVFEKHRPTHVIHLAGKVGGVVNNMENNMDFWRFNIAMNNNIVYQSYKYGVRKLVSTMSTCVYPDKITYPIDESMLHNGEPHFSNPGFAYSKRMLDVMSRICHDTYGCMFTTIIPCNVFGPHDNFNLIDGHVVAGLIHKVYLAKKNNTELVMWGTGSPLRQFIFSDDLARLIIKVMRDYESPEPIILAPDEDSEITIYDTANLIKKCMGYEGQIVRDTSKPDGQHKKTASNAKLMKFVPDFKFTPIEQAMKATCDWFMANYETCRK